MTLIDKAEALALIASQMKDARRTYKGFGHAQEALRFAEQMLAATVTALEPQPVPDVQPLIDAAVAKALEDAAWVKVKPLVWERADEDDGVPQWVSGIYFIRYTAAGYKLRINGTEMPKRYLGNDGDDQAKADAYKDHEARIVAALAPTDAATEKGGDAHARHGVQAPDATSPGITAGADAAHVNKTPKSEHDAGNVLTAAQAREAALRLRAYMDRRKRAHGFDQETVHTFDAGTDSEANLTVADLEAILSLIGERP